MFHRRLRAPSKPTTFALLMAVSVVLLVVPIDLLAPLRSLMQVIAYPQWAVRKTAAKAVKPLHVLTAERGDTQEIERLRQDNQGLVNENTSLRQQIEEYRLTIQELALLRQSNFPSNGTLIPAPVIALDAVPRRDSLLLGKGQLQGVKYEDWIASRLFVQAGQEAGVQDHLAVLARESLIGKIEQVAPMTSRVVLLSDPYANRAMRVHILHHDPQASRYLQVTVDGKPAEFALRGTGNGLMVVSDIHQEFIDQGVIRTGDLVTSDPREAKLPVGMVIGEIVELKHNKAKPLYHDALVRHRYDPQSLSQVYIVDLARTVDKDR